jgi:hypothetical protein
MKLAAVGGCARFGMDDGHMIGPREVVFKILAEFTKGIETSTNCDLVARKKKMYKLDDGARLERLHGKKHYSEGADPHEGRGLCYGKRGPPKGHHNIQHAHRRARVCGKSSAG